MEHPYPVGLRVRNFGERWPGSQRGTATIIDNTVLARNRDQEYLVRKDKPLYTGSDNFVSQWSDYGTVPAEFPTDQEHAIEFERPKAACTCGFTGDEELAAHHARAYGLCGTCWGSGTDAYPCLGRCEMCGGAGDAETEARALASMAAAYADQEA